MVRKLSGWRWWVFSPSAPFLSTPSTAALNAARQLLCCLTVWPSLLNRFNGGDVMRRHERFASVPARQKNGDDDDRSHGLRHSLRT
jgi:hypothetical protein